MSVNKYKIIRQYFDDKYAPRTLRGKKGLTLKQAQAHCQDKETSSSTCTTPQGKAITKAFGAWFDSYTDDK